MYFIISIIIIVLAILYFLFSETNSGNGSPAPKDYSCFIQRIITNTNTDKILNVQPLVMSGWGLESDNILGFCGESAFKSAMLYHGNYVSQFQVYNVVGGQFLLGTNDQIACQKFHIQYNQWYGLEIADALAYIRSNLDKNLPVLIGAMTNEEDGDPSMDHTIPLIGYSLNANTNNIDYIIYNDLFTIYPLKMNCTLDVTTNVPKCYRTRDKCTPTKSPDQFYSPLQQCIPDLHGIEDPPGMAAKICMLTILGNEDPYHELYPVMIVLDSINRTEPDSSLTEDNLNYDPVQLGCTITAGCLTPGKDYSLLRFSNTLLPPGHFIHGSYSNRTDFTAKDTSYTTRISDDPTFLSNGTYFFRCVALDYNPSETLAHPVLKVQTTQNIIPYRPRPNIKNSFTSKRISDKKTKRKARRNAKLRTSANRAIYSACIPTGVPITDNVCSIIAPVVHQNWVWSFPPNPKNLAQDPSNNATTPDLGCLNLVLTAVVPTDDSLIDQVCTFFTIQVVDSTGTDVSSSTLDYDGNPFNGGDNGDTIGYIGTDGMPSFACLGSWYFTAVTVSFDSTKNNYTMMSENGSTVSTLTPIA